MISNGNYLTCIFMNFQYNIKMKKRVKNQLSHKNLFQTSTIIVAHCYCINYSILKDFENASLVLLLLSLRIHDISAKIFLN